MPGLDRRILDQIDPSSVLPHIKADIRSDFIPAPHYNIVFSKVGDELWDQLRSRLESGTYQPELPITMSVPKERWFSRPGSILKPFDRFLYQALADSVSSTLEDTLDRKRTFSHVPSRKSGEMFKPNHECWQKFQTQVSRICKRSKFVLRADISNYFERLPHHHLINLMTAASCPPEVVKLIEEMLLAFRERNSFGIVQGLYPSDLLGNFFLSDFDAFCEISALPSARYVDDIYVGFQSERDARVGLERLIERLRKNGLNLNELKTSILKSADAERDETALDRLFDEIRNEIEDDQTYDRASPYGFEIEWDEDSDVEAEDEIDLENAAVERLFNSVEDHPRHEDQIEKFCLPILRTASSDIAVDYVIDKLLHKPYQTRLYSSYLSKFVRSNSEVVRSLSSLLSSENMSPYQTMFLLAALLRAQAPGGNSIVSALQLLQNRQIASETRAMAAIFAARHGTGPQKRAVRTSYEDEPSDYVRSAILHSARYFTTADKRTCKHAWGGHNALNALICKTF